MLVLCRSPLFTKSSVCRAVRDEMGSFMRQTKSEFKELIIGFRKINDQLSALDTQLNSLPLLNESPKQKKSVTREVTAPEIAGQIDPTAIIKPLTVSLATPRGGTVKIRHPNFR